MSAVSKVPIVIDAPSVAIVRNVSVRSVCKIVHSVLTVLIVGTASPVPIVPTAMILRV